MSKFLVLCQQNFYKSLIHLFRLDFALALGNFHSSCLHAPRFAQQKNLSANFCKNFVDRALIAILGIFFFFSALHADLIDPDVQAATEGDPSNTICDCVSLLTGDFVAFSEDLVIDGAEPLYIHRHYVSGDGVGYNGGWEFFPHLELKMIPKKTKVKKGKRVGKDYRRIVVTEPNGTRLIFKRQKKTNLRKVWVPYAVDFEKHGKGITNTSRGPISGKTNLRNHILHQETENRIMLHCADGTKRYFRKSKGGAYPTYLLRWEKLPGGNKIHYRYGDDDRIEYIYSSNNINTKTYAWCRFHYKKSENRNHDFEIETSDGRRLSYEFICKKKKTNPRFFLKQVNGPELPPEGVEYTRRHDSTDHLVEARCLPDGRKIAVEYYLPYTTCTVANTEVNIGGCKDPGADRVKTLFQPVGKDGQLVPTHHFIYDIERKIDDGIYSYEKKGTTEIYDVDHNKTSVHYTPDFLPLEVRYHEKDRLHHRFQMQWGEFGQLQQKTLLGDDDRPLLKREFFYDDRGNILQEMLTGNICVPDSQDTFTENHEYDERNRLIKTISDTGLVTHISYLPKTHLVQKKIITDEKAIHIREFYEYNKDKVLITKIIDNGISDDPNNLEKVTERRIERIHPKQEAPAQDLPEIIEEKILDLTTKTEILLKKIHIHYNNQAKIIQKDIYDADDTHRYSLNFSYDERGRLAEEKNAFKEITSLKYDIHGNVIFQEDPSKKQIRRTYDHANRLTDEEEITPNEEKRLTQYAYDTKNNKTATIDPFGNETRYEYDAFGHVTKIIHPDGAEETFTYDILGHLSSHIDPSEHTTYKTHNALGKPLKILHPDGSCETFSYYSDCNLQSHTNQDGLKILHFYDPMGRETAVHYFDSTGEKIAEETFDYDSFHLLAHKDKEGILTTYDYDQAGRKKAEQREHQRREYEYDSLGRLYKETQVNENNNLITVYERDLLDQIIVERQEDENGSVLHTVSYAYDTLGNKTAVIRKEGKESFTYDCFNRLIAHENGEGYRTIIAYDENHINRDGQKVLRKVTRDPMGYQTIEIYDAMMRPVRKEIRSPHGILYFAEDYVLDSCGNCELQRCHVYREDIYYITLEITKEYDEMHRTISIQEGAYTPEEKTTTFTYTGSGNLASTKKADGVTLQYTYDPLGNLIHLVSSDATIDYTYEHNLNGELLSSCDHLHKTSTKRTLDTAGNILEETLANGLKIENQYDHACRRTLLRLPKETEIHYTYDPLYLREVSAFGMSATYSYDQSGNLRNLKMIEPISYRYDKMQRKTELFTPRFNQILHYDPRGNIEEMLKDEKFYEFKYDGLNQLIKERNHSYTYDSYYNRHSKDDISYMTNTLHALVHAGNTTYTYDRNGNPLIKKTSTSQTQYKYDALDRLIEVTEENEYRLVFTYDSFHRRMTKTLYSSNNGNWSKSTHLNFLYDQEKEIGACDEKGRLLELRILGRSEHEALLFQLNDTLYMPIQDLHGNVVRLFSLDKSQSYFYQYDAFGEWAPYPDFNPWHYSSKRLDPETGLIYFGKRYYDPQNGRWLTPDPNTFTDSANLYAYTFNNPLIFLDPYGLFSVDFSKFNVSDQTRGPPPQEFKYTSFAEQAPFFYRMNHTIEGIPSLYQPPVPKFEQASIYDLKRPEPMNRRLMCINGIRTDSKDAMGTAFYISDLAGGYNVHLVHSPTFGFQLDIMHCEMMLNYQITEPSMLLHQAWNDYFQNAGPTATVLVIGYSGGNIATRNALLTYDPELRKRISVLGIAPGAYVDPDICGGVRHYRSKRDFVPKIDTYGAKKYAGTIYDLEPHPKANKLLDHTIQSPTYAPHLKKNIALYLKHGIIESWQEK